LRRIRERGRVRKLAVFGRLGGTVVSNGDLTEPASKARAKNL
jgi:hypothetical protein